ncbi:MAG TPA: hypothetical protein VGN37_25615 [Actinocatenispora sp.]
MIVDVEPSALRGFADNVRWRIGLPARQHRHLVGKRAPAEGPAQVGDTLTDTEGIAAWIDEMLASVGLKRFVVDGLKSVMGTTACRGATPMPGVTSRRPSTAWSRT